MPHPEETEQPLPRVVGGGRRLPKRLLAALGIVIALVTAGVLFRLLGNGEAAEEVATPSVIEPQTREEVAPAGPSEEVLPSNPVADSAAAPVAGPQSEAVSLSELESLSDRVLESISTYYGRDGAYSRGEIECAELQAAFVEVMDSWIDYNTRGKAGWQGRLPPDLVERDERLYLGVQDVERLLEASSCPRP